MLALSGCEKFKKIVEDYSVWIYLAVAVFEAVKFVMYMAAFLYTITQQGITKALTTFWKIVTAPIHTAKLYATSQTEKNPTSNQFTRVKYIKAQGGEESQIKMLEGPPTKLRQLKHSDFGK